MMVMEGALKGKRRSSEEAMAGQHEGVERKTLQGMKGTGTSLGQAEEAVLVMAIVCRRTS